jgi:hypothetical protein
VNRHFRAPTGIFVYSNFKEHPATGGNSIWAAQRVQPDNTLQEVAKLSTTVEQGDEKMHVLRKRDHRKAAKPELVLAN